MSNPAAKSSAKPLKATKNKVVELFITFYDSQGEELSQEHCQYLHGGHQDILPKIEAALDQQSIGFETTLYLEPEDAFGEYDENLLFLEPRNLFPEGIKEGMMFEGIPARKGAEPEDEPSMHSEANKTGLQKDVETFMAENDFDDIEAGDDIDDDTPRFFIVQQVTPTHVLLDANPEWAGMAIQVFCRIEDIREALPEELAQGFAHDLEEDEEPLVSVLPKKDTKLH